jgi:predicted nuclease with TOPRIM domain
MKPTVSVSSFVLEDDEPTAFNKDPEIAELKSSAGNCLSLLERARNMCDDGKHSYDAILSHTSVAYKYAPTRELKELIGEINRLLKSARTLHNRAEKKQERLQTTHLTKRQVKNQMASSYEAIHQKMDETKSSFGMAFSLLANHQQKLNGAGFTSLKDEYHVDLAEHNSSFYNVVDARAALLVGVKRPIDKDDIAASDYNISHIDSFLYVFKNARVLGFLASALPRNFSERDLRIIANRSLGIDLDICTTKMMHSSSTNRVWFMVYPFSNPLRSIQFADRSASPEFEAYKNLSNTATYAEVHAELIKQGFSVVQQKDIMSRWYVADSNKSRNAIIMDALMTKKRQDAMMKQREARVQFETDMQEYMQDLVLLKDDYDTYAERITKLKDKFALITSPDGVVENGLTFGQYSKLSRRFEMIEASNVRTDKDSFSRTMQREAVRKDRIEARRLYWEFVLIRREQKIVWDTITALEGRIEFLREKRLKGND